MIKVLNFRNLIYIFNFLIFKNFTSVKATTTTPVVTTTTTPAPATTTTTSAPTTGDPVTSGVVTGPGTTIGETNNTTAEETSTSSVLASTTEIYTEPVNATETQPYDNNQTVPDTTTTGYGETSATTGFTDTLNPDFTWGEWSGCTASCGGGKKYRYRRCNNTEVSCDGNDLIDNLGFRNFTIGINDTETTASPGTTNAGTTYTTTTEWFEENSTQPYEGSGDYTDERPPPEYEYGTDCAVCNTQSCELILVDQPECTCADGALSCASPDCSGNKKCEITAWENGAGSEYRCVPNDFGHCGCYGDPHCKEGFDNFCFKVQSLNAKLSKSFDHLSFFLRFSDPETS